MLTLKEEYEVEREVNRFNHLLDRFAPKDKVAFEIKWELNEYDESPKYGLVAKLGSGVLYQFETDDKEFAETLQRKVV